MATWSNRHRVRVRDAFIHLSNLPRQMRHAPTLVVQERSGKPVRLANRVAQWPTIGVVLWQMKWEPVQPVKRSFCPSA